MEQGKRTLALTTPLGTDALLLRSLRGREEMSRPFAFDLDMVAESNDIDPVKLIGEAVSFSVEVEGNAPRYFHGVVSRFTAGELDDSGLRSYHALVVPYFWFLTKAADCKIFQEKTLQQIVEEVFADHGVPNDGFRFELSKPPPPFVYCVQYRETAFNFISRLLEAEGIFYFFTFEKDSHCMVITDDASSYSPCPEKQLIHAKGDRSGKHFHDWAHCYQVISESWANQDYNYETPSAALLQEEPAQGKYSTAKYGVYEFPGEFGDQEHASARARVRIEEEEASFDLVEASGTYPGLVVGATFEMSEHDCPAEESKEYVILSVRHTAAEGSYSHAGSSSTQYANNALLMPSDRVFRPHRTTPKPLVNGPQTALVVGPGGEEIYTDEFGRIRVQFRWDRIGKHDENSSCWIRVAQNWAGNQWGTYFLPRIGQEVVVHFMDGDPDRPLVTAGVYNPEQMPPHKLPDDKTQGLIKTRSSKGGGAENFNMIRFEDKKGAEEVYFHAEKDQTEEIENDQQIHVGHDRREAIDNDRSLTVGGDKSETVEGNKGVTIRKNHSESISGEMTLSVSKSRAMSITKDLTESVDGAMTVSIAKDRRTGIDGDMDLTVKKDVTIRIDGKRTQTVKKAYALKAKSVAVEASDEIVLKTGKAKIQMKKNGDITISGAKITVKGSGPVTLKGSKVNAN